MNRFLPTCRFSGKHLGDFAFTQDSFKGVDSFLKECKNKEFRALNEREKIERISRALCTFIQEAPEPAFLLSATVAFIDAVHQEKILEQYPFSLFELWLNQYSGLSAEENQRIRAKIVGKWVPRGDYQLFFPVGMNKTYAGTHFVTAHSSPDVDTTIASFWGWVDAFGARVGDGLHIWNVPGGLPFSQVEIELLFYDLFGKEIFPVLAKGNRALMLSGTDLLTQKGVILKHLNESTFSIHQESEQQAVILVDEEGHYLGEWRTADTEGIRQVMQLLNQSLRWYANYLQLGIVSVFAKSSVAKADIQAFRQKVFGMPIKECAPVQEFTEKQLVHFQDYLCEVLQVKKGLDSTFEEFAKEMKKLSINEFHAFIQQIIALEHSSLFDSSGHLSENRPQLFQHLEAILKGLDQAIFSIRSYVEQLGIALSIKQSVFKHFPPVINQRADVEEIRSKMGSHAYLTVTHSDAQGRQVPLGVTYASDLYKSVLGTVSLRDFSNREETRIPPYLEIISVIDHHKSTLHSTYPSVFVISDAQSSNALVAELTFKLNDRYSTGGMSRKEIEEQIHGMKEDLSSGENQRLLQSLLGRLRACDTRKDLYIDPRREFIEYLHFFYAILDDTDLLTKVSPKDVICIASLLNRLKSLMLGKAVEVINLEDIPKDESFASNAAKKILQNEDMCSLCRKIYLLKEKVVEENFALCVQGKPSTFFNDTKEQNGCCRVGQTKMFAKNYPAFKRYAPQLRAIWIEGAQEVHRDKSEVDLHLHMISTIVGAEDLLAGRGGKHTHKDELWIWIPETDQGTAHLKSFLYAFKGLDVLPSHHPEVEFLGKNALELQQLFTESFFPIPCILPEKGSKGLPMAVLRFDAGAINSRKAMISPFLPLLT